MLKKIVVYYPGEKDFPITWEIIKDGSVITSENWNRGLVGLEGIDRLYWQDDKGKKYVFDGVYINGKKSKEVFTRVPVAG